MAAMVAVGCAALALGCGDDDSAPAANTTGAGGPLVVYEREGGIAYTAQRMVVEQDGSTAVSVEGPGQIGAEFELSKRELDELRRLLDAATLESPGPSGCNDCYAYVIESGGRTASFDHTNYPPGMEPVVELLSEILERETPSGPARNAK